jgi:hypothetical protein
MGGAHSSHRGVDGSLSIFCRDSVSGCFDSECQTAADRELLGFRMCTPHYIEALEHSAHVVSRPVGELIIEHNEREEKRLVPIKECLEKRLRIKREIERATGRPSSFPIIEPGAIQLSDEPSSQPADSPPKPVPEPAS